MSESHLVSEMRETAAVLRDFDFSVGAGMAESVLRKGRLLLTGEGSSRILPAHAFLDLALRHGLKIPAYTQGSYQACEYDLSDAAVMVASNSGRTKEALTLVRKLVAAGNKEVWGVTATPGTPIATECPHAVVLKCGGEQAVAATKSVVEQALVYEALLAALCKLDLGAAQAKAAAAIDAILNATVDPEIVASVAKSRMIFFAGRNDGVAEELALKTNEIVRIPSGYLEGTIALHGPEEIMRENDTVVFLEPFETEFEFMEKIFNKEVGCNVVCISSRETPFKTIRIPSVPDFDWALRLGAGWNLLASTGISLGIDLDHPTRARKIGNEAK